MTAAGRWYRVSGDKQDEQNQYTRVDKRIADRGWIPGKEYVLHALSASKREQIELMDQMLADMQSGLIDCLVMRHTDRIDRTEELSSVLKRIKEAGGWIESIEEPWVAELGGLPAKVMTGVTEWMNAEYVRKLSSNVIDSHVTRRTAGSLFAGKAPNGYDIIGYHADGSKHPKPGKCVLCGPPRGGRKTLEPNELAPVIKRIFTLADEGESCAKIARALHADGIAAYHGGKAWNEGVIRTLIKNPVYRGHVQYQGMTYMTVEPLVSSVLWKSANDSMTARGRNSGHGGGRKSATLLLPECGRCKAPMYATLKAAEPIEWATYRCAGVGPDGTSAQRKGCGNTIKMLLLDAEITAEFEAADDAEVIETVISGSDYAEEITETQLAIKDLDVMADDYDERHAALVTELRRLRSLPSQPARVESVYTGRSEGDAFRAMERDERVTFMRRWTLTVHPEGAEPRWALTRGGTSDLTAAEALTRWQSEPRSQSS